MAFSQRHLILGFFLSFVSLLQAQRAPEQTRPDLATHQLSVLTLNESPELADLFYINSASKRGGGEIELTFKSNARSTPLSVDGKPIRIAKRVVNPETKVAVFQPIAEIPWPAGDPERVLLLGTTDKAGKVHIMALDDSLKAFPLHSIRVINATGIELTAQINDFKGVLNTGINAPIKYPDMEKITERMLVRYPFGLAIKKPDGNFEVTNSGKLEAAKNTRSLIIIRPPAAEGSTKVRVQVLMDRPVPKPKAP